MQFFCRSRFCIQYLHELLPPPSPTAVSLTHFTLLPNQWELVVAKYICSVISLGTDECPETVSLVPRVFSLPIIEGYLPSPPADPYAAIAALIKNMAKQLALTKVSLKVLTL